jgi:TonB-dependent starch-binding outer membrane protein SusC
MKRLARPLGLLVWLFLCWLPPTFAQTGQTITGTVIDEKGNPVVGASVTEKGQTTNGASTSQDGKFTLTFRGTAGRLLISFIGYEKQEVRTGSSPVIIKLKPDERAMTDVVVIGYQSQKRRNVTAAVATVNGKDIANIPQSSFDQTLQGRLTGVSVLSSTGELGSKPSIVIRGATNIDYGNGNGGNTGPLYVIDGVIYDVNAIGSSYSNSNPLSLINANDIESIDVLKDASASAIYGARAGNGVIIIKTKSARPGKPQISASAYAGVTIRPAFRDVYIGNTERALKLQLLHDQLPYNNFQQGQIPVQITDSLNPVFNNNVDWQGLMIRDNAVVNSQDMAIAGYFGNNNSYRLSINHYNEQGVVNGFSLRRLAPHLHVNIKPIKRMSIATDIMISSEKRMHGVGGSTGALFNSWSFPSSFVQLTPEQEAVFRGDKSYYDDNRIFTIVGSVNLVDTIVRNLTFNSNFSATNYNDKYAYFSPLELNGLQNTAYDINTTNPGWSFENYLTYENRFKDHHFAVAAGTSSYSNKQYYTYAYAKGINVTGITTLQTVPSGANLYASSNTSRKTTVSYYGRLLYDYAGKYLLTASFRRDASSIYSSSYRWGTFPSVSVGWIASDENFFEPLKKYINFMKVRASYGITGNDPGSWYAKYQALQTDASYMLSTTGTLGSSGSWVYLAGTPSTYNGSPVVSPFPYNSEFYNAGVSSSDNVRWEKFPQIDIGADIELFNNRVTMVVDWYQKDANDKYFWNIPAQITSGYAYYSGNYVNVRNRGLEIGLNTKNLPSQSKFQWNTNFNISFNDNYVTKLPNSNRDFLFGPSWFQQTLTYGEPLFNYKVYQIDGVYATEKEVPVDPITGRRLSFQGAALTAGDPAYIDNNGDFNINYDDKVIAGNPMPKVTGGFGNSFSWKGLNLTVFCSFVGGRKIFNGYLSDYLNGSRSFQAWGSVSGPAAITNMLDQFWTKPGDRTKFPRMVYPNGTAQDPWNIASSYFVEDGSFIRVRNITLGYTLPHGVVKNMGLKRLNVYGMVDNAFTFKRTKVIPDPELVDPTTGSANVVYPTALKFTLGLNIEL